MKMFAYSPDTGEFINTEAPADWMGKTNITPPGYDPQSSGCFFRNGAWEIDLPKGPTVAEHQAAIDAQISALEQRQLLPRVTREGLLSAAVALAATQGVSEPQLYAANIAYKKLKDFDASIVTLRAERDAIK